MTIKEEMTTPVAPVGAGAEQSSQNQSTSIIPEINEDFNTSDEFFSADDESLLPQNRFNERALRNRVPEQTADY